MVTEGALDGFPVADPAPHEALIGLLNLEERVVQHDVAPDFGETERRQRVRDEVHVVPLQARVAGADDVDRPFDDALLGWWRVHQEARRKPVARPQVVEAGGHDRQLHPGGRHVVAVRVVTEERGAGIQVLHVDADGPVEAETPADRMEPPPEVGERVLGVGRGSFPRERRSPGGEGRSAGEDAQGSTPVHPPVRAGVPGTMTVHDAGSWFGFVPTKSPKCLRTAVRSASRSSTGHKDTPAA